MTITKSLFATSLFATAAMTVSLIGCSQATSAVTDNHEADIRAIHEMEDAWIKVWTTKQIGGMVGNYYADDGKLFFPDAPMVAGLPAINATIKDMLQDPSATYYDTEPSKVEVSKAGDMAYSYGAGTLTFTDPASKKVVTLKGKYVEVYKRQPDGKWKDVADIYNEDAPPTPVK